MGTYKGNSRATLGLRRGSRPSPCRMPSMARVLQRGAASLALAILAILGGSPGSALAERSGSDQVALEQFVQRARRYVELRREAAAAALPLEESASPEQIRARERALADAIRGRRPKARRGEVFGAAREPIVTIVRADWRQRSAKERSALAAETPDVAPPSVNAAYPAQLPLATFPPELLEALPRLPKELEYRFAGPHLILRDVEANLVVDVAPDVLGGAPH